MDEASEKPVEVESSTEKPVEIEPSPEKITEKPAEIIQPTNVKRGLHGPSIGLGAGIAIISIIAVAATTQFREFRK